MEGVDSGNGKCMNQIGDDICKETTEIQSFYPHKWRLVEN